MRICAFDIESTGDGQTIIAIGAVILDVDTLEVVRIAKFVSIPEELTFETRCLVEFWMKFPKVFEALWKSQFNVPGTDLAKEFRLFLKEHEQKGDILVSDNTAYDAAEIQHNLQLQNFRSLNGNRLPSILYRMTGTGQSYRGLEDVGSWERGALGSAYKKKTIDEVYDTDEFNSRLQDVEHDHFPWNDALTIAYRAAKVLHIELGRIKQRAPNPDAE